MDQLSWEKSTAVAFDEERLLFLWTCAFATPAHTMVDVTSQPVHPLILEYYFQLLAGNPP